MPRFRNAQDGQGQGWSVATVAEAHAIGSQVSSQSGASHGHASARQGRQELMQALREYFAQVAPRQDDANAVGPGGKVQQDADSEPHAARSGPAPGDWSDRCIGALIEFTTN